MHRAGGRQWYSPEVDSQTATSSNTAGQLLANASQTYHDDRNMCLSTDEASPLEPLRGCQLAKGSLPNSGDLGGQGDEVFVNPKATVAFH